MGKNVHIAKIFKPRLGPFVKATALLGEVNQLLKCNDSNDSVWYCCRRAARQEQNVYLKWCANKCSVFQKYQAVVAILIKPAVGPNRCHRVFGAWRSHIAIHQGRKVKVGGRGEVKGERALWIQSAALQEHRPTPSQSRGGHSGGAEGSLRPSR